MRRVVIIGLAAMLLIVVAAVFVSPAIDLDPAALRSPSWTLVLLSFLVFFRELPALLQFAKLSVQLLPNRNWPTHPALHPIFELNCARLF